MYYANRVFHRLRFYVVLYDYDIWLGLRILLKCIAIYESLTQSNKSATIMPTLSSVQNEDSEWRSLTFELFRTLLFLNLLKFPELYSKYFETHNYIQARSCV